MEGRWGRVMAVLFPSLSDEERLLFPSEHPWQALEDLERVLSDWVGEGVHVSAGVKLEGVYVGASGVLLGPGARVEPTAVLTGGPIYVGEGAEIRSGAYVRGPAYIGEGAVVGHATEVKRSIFLHGAKAPHFAYVGDSILGTDSNLGAGTKLANLRLDGEVIRVTWDGVRKGTDMRKLGALIGEGVQVGCNAVLNPGTVVLPGRNVPPCTAVRGTLDKET